MTDLIQQAEALEARACEHEKSAKNLTVSAERCRAEAAKLREAAREPLRLWVNVGGGMNPAAFTSESEARHCASMERDRIAVPMVEVRPVRITPESLQQAYHRYHGINGNMRAVIEYALSLAGVEVEK